MMKHLQNHLQNLSFSAKSTCDSPKPCGLLECHSPGQRGKQQTQKKSQVSQTASMVANWGVICNLPPFRGTRNNHWWPGIPSLKLTAKAPANRSKPKRKRESIPTIHFQVRTVSFRERMIYEHSKYSYLLSTWSIFVEDNFFVDFNQE